MITFMKHNFYEKKLIDLIFFLKNHALKKFNEILSISKKNVEENLFLVKYFNPFFKYTSIKQNF